MEQPLVLVEIPSPLFVDPDQNDVVLFFVDGLDDVLDRKSVV